MDDIDERAFVAWRVNGLNELKKITHHIFYEDTKLNLGRILRCENSLTNKTMKKIYTYYNMTRIEFYEPWDEFMMIHYKKKQQCLS